VVYSSTVSLSRCPTLSTTISSRSRRQHRFLLSTAERLSTTTTSHFLGLALVLRFLPSEPSRFARRYSQDQYLLPRSQARSASPSSPSSSTRVQPTTSRGPFRLRRGPGPTSLVLHSATGPSLLLPRRHRLPVFLTPRSLSRLPIPSGRTPRTMSPIPRLLLPPL
jgi:hypothetical protein